ncbi:hypothetical protein GCM10009534_15390 [Kribbella sandramycini]
MLDAADRDPRAIGDPPDRHLGDPFGVDEREHRVQDRRPPRVVRGTLTSHVSYHPEQNNTLVLIR